MAEVHINPLEKDSRFFVWGSAKFTSAKYYNFVFGRFPQDSAMQSIWKSKSLPKLRVFDWLLIKDRLNTKDIMLRKSWHLQEGPNCILCDSLQLETRDHLFFTCPFAIECWNMISIQWDCSLPISARLQDGKEGFLGPCFTEIFSCAAWNIWKERNDYIFRSQLPSIDRWKVRFQSDISLHRFRLKEHSVQPLLDWFLDTFT